MKMVESNKDLLKKKKKNKMEPDDRYLGLSRQEVALRERMAKKFGRDVTHLDPNAKRPEETKEGDRPSQKNLERARVSTVSQKML